MKPLLIFIFLSSCSFTSSQFVCQPTDKSDDAICEDGIWISKPDSSKKKDASIDPDLPGKGDMGIDLDIPDLPNLCGNNNVDEGEDCDGTTTQTCKALGFDNGALGCVDCTFDTTNCVRNSCNNGSLDEGEECDQQVFRDGITCAGVDKFSGGKIKCTSNCVLDTSTCFMCGDGVINEGEECDTDALNGAVCDADGEIKCSTSCTLDKSDCSKCGDGNIEGAEKCDGTKFGGLTCTDVRGYASQGILECTRQCQIQDKNCRAVFDQVSAGDGHSCAHRSDGSITCWGANTQQEVSDTPRTKNFLSVEAGKEYSCALQDTKSILCWGRSDRINHPTQGNFVELSAGKDNACVIGMNGALACWGDASDGRTMPAIHPNGFRSVSSWDKLGCALRKIDGGISCWGTQLDSPNLNLGFKSVSVGKDFLCAINSQLQIECNGVASDGNLSSPAGSFVYLDVGDLHSCVIADTTGYVTCWGKNDEGQRDLPVNLETKAFSQLSAGKKHTCAVDADGNIHCWGRDIEGQSDAPSVLP